MCITALNGKQLSESFVDAQGVIQMNTAQVEMLVAA